MSKAKKQCFVCELEFSAELLRLNPEVNLHVCQNCNGSNKEKLKVKELLDSLAEGFVCGCI